MKDFFVVYKVRMVRPAVANVNTQADEPHTKPGQRALPTVALPQGEPLSVLMRSGRP